MNDEKKVTSIKQKVTSIETARHKRTMDEHERGERFAFEPYVFEDASIGLLDEHDLRDQVTIVLHGLKGVYMDIEDAEKLGVALIQAAFCARGHAPKR